MIDLLSATQSAIFTALAAGVDPDIAPVFQHVPEGTQPPMIIVGDMEAEVSETKGSEDHTVEVLFVHRGKGRAGLLAMMHAARQAIDGQPITAAGAVLEAPQWLSSEAVGADDGITYAGLQRYLVIAEPAG